MAALDWPNAPRLAKITKSDLVLTSDQGRALDLIESLTSGALSEAAFCVIDGYAGTGKTTLLKHLGYLHPLQLAPTGRAALRLTEATGIRSQTIHRALYSVREDASGELHFTLRDAEPPPDCQLVVVDEASMVPERVFRDVLAWAAQHGLPVVFVGDSAQLPPVADHGGLGFNVLKYPTPHRVGMTEVVRQAATSPILAASLHLRGGDWRKALRLLPSVEPEFLLEEAHDASQRGGMIIVHTNRTRNALNTALRDLQGYRPGELRAGEPLLVLRNSYALDRYNGEVVTFTGWIHPPEPVFWEARQRTVHFGIAEIDGAGEAWLCQEVVDGLVDGRAVRQLPRELEKRLGDDSLDRLPFLHAELGYALTCHKAQGSEADDVLVVIEPSVPIDTREGQQWAYTAITRARRRVRVQFARSEEGLDQ